MRLLFTFLLLIPFIALHSQQIEVLAQGGEADISHYDIFKVNSNEFWVGGKNGSLVKLDTNQNIESIPYPSTGAHILKIAAFSPSKILIAAAEGTLYLHDTTTGSWKTFSIPKYRNRTFYDIQVVDSLTAYISGGASAIAEAKIAIPRGFILMTNDGGHTWKEVWQNPLYMVWGLHHNIEEQRIYASLYSPLGSKILHTSTHSATNWEKYRLHNNLLFHAINTAEAMVLVGGRHFNMKEDGIIYDVVDHTLREFHKTGMIWSYVKGDDYDLFTACYGKLISKNRSTGAYEVLQTPVNHNLYEGMFINDHTAYIIGSRNTILKVTLTRNSSQGS